MIVQQGSINTTALVVPGLYVQVVAPRSISLNGVPSGRLGVVGTATWGPVNTPVIVGTVAQYVASFGPWQPRAYDMGTHVVIAAQQGANDFRCVRVTDGTDVAASYSLLASGGLEPMTVTARYTGTYGNTIQVALAQLPNSTWQLTLSVPGYPVEAFTVANNATAATVWTNLVNAVNNGTGPLRGPSQLCTATLGTATTTAVAAVTTTPLVGGTDGTTTINAATLVGADTTPRTGMYALRSQGCSVGVLADVTDLTQASVQASFGLGEGIYMIAAIAAGTSVATAAANKASAGIDTYAVKLMHGDWIWWNDPLTGTPRLVSPQPFMAGLLANLSPEQSSLNKKVYGVAGSQRSGMVGSTQSGTYSYAELQTLDQNGIDLICNPIPAGNTWGVQLGHNTSSNPATSGDNYTRMTNYIAATLNAGMGLFVGRVINSNLFNEVSGTLLNFFSGMLQQGLLGSTDGSLPYSVTCNVGNNPQSRTALGYLQADTQVRYQAINEKFIVNLEGGTTVVIAKQTLPAA